MIFITGDTHRDFDRLEELLYCTESSDDKTKLGEEKTMYG